MDAEFTISNFEKVFHERYFVVTFSQAYFMCYTSLMNSKHEEFNAIYDAHYLEIKKFIYTIARRDTSITDDIFQNTWENAFRYFHTLKDVNSARAWLYTIARNETKRWFSQKTNKMFTEIESMDADDAPEIADETIDFPEELANKDMLAKAINKLSEEEQQLILLNYYYDISLKEIASMYDMNYNSLKSITRRALKKLQDAEEG